MDASRRDFCISAMLGFAGSRLIPSDVASGNEDRKPEIPVVDTHTHFYDPTRPEGVPFPSKEDQLLYRPVLPKEFQQLTQLYGVVGTVIVEASPWVEDNQWLLDLAAKDPFVLGVVGNLNPGTQLFAGHLARFARNPVYRGIRVNSGPLKEGLERAEYLADLARMVDLDLELDVNGGLEMLPLVDRLADKLPDLRIVINHLANLRINGKTPPNDWIAGLKRVARHPKVWMKVSALVEGASIESRPSPTDTTFYRPVLQEAWNAFGEDRLIFGSNWPVSVRAGSYALVFQIVKDFWSDLGLVAMKKFFAQNAQSAYKWPKRG